MSRQPPPVFLERQSYRRRRIRDAARLLPVLGVLLLAVPLLWPSADPAPRDAVSNDVSMSAAMVYVFSTWAFLIAATAVLGALVSRWVRESATEDAERGEDTDRLV
ncbi:MAG: hypothetical protein AAGA05_06445 [Pseudomonadota bacterium]